MLREGIKTWDALKGAQHWKGGGKDVEYGYKGKGVTSHVLADGLGNPLKITATSAAGDERQQITPLLKKNHSMA